MMCWLEWSALNEGCDCTLQMLFAFKMFAFLLKGMDQNIPCKHFKNICACLIQTFWNIWCSDSCKSTALENMALHICTKDTDISYLTIPQIQAHAHVMELAA